jgi:hypothetical protein
MNRLRILTADAAAVGDDLDDLLDTHPPDVVALTGVGPARASRLASGRGMRSATQSWFDGDEAGLALLWRATLAVDSLDRFEFGQLKDPCGALRITFPLQGHPVSVYCASLSPDRTVAAGQQARLAALFDLRSEPSLAACDGIVTQAGLRWSRCEAAWSTANRRVISLAAPADVGLTAQRAFGIASGPGALNGPWAAGPAWHCSEEFDVIETRTISGPRAPHSPVRIAHVDLRAGLAERHLAVAL